MNENKNVPELRFPRFEGEWLVHQLSQACNMKAGKFVQASEIHNEKESGMYPCFGGNGLRGYTRSKTHEGLYPLIGRQGALCGNVQLANGQFHATEHAVVVEASEQNDALWLYYLLDTLKLNRYATGQAQPGLSVDVIEKIKAYFPSLSEQQIAGFLSAVDKKIEQLTEKHRLLTQYKKGVMQQIFSQQIRFKDDEGNEYPEWEEKRLGDLSDVRDGTHESPRFFDRGYPLITSKNLLKNGKLDLENVSFISEADYEQINKRSKVDEGDILFGMIGTIGNPVKVNSSQFAIKNVALIKQKNMLHNDFLIHYLRSHLIEKQFHQQNTGGTQKFIALGVIRNLVVLMPCLNEQQKIADFLTAIDNKIDQAWSKLEQAKAFKNGLLQKMFC